MTWRSFAASTDRDGLDDLEALFWEAGAVSVTVEDGGDNPLFEPAPGDTPVWDDVVVTGLFEQDADLGGFRAALEQRGFPVLFIDEVADRDWEREWLTRFTPMCFGDRLWICPTGSSVPEPNAVVMNLDPGLAFGTGTHATTRMCLAWLDRHLRPGSTVMDYGCGSGVLGIAALLLGADSVQAVDNDPQAIAATLENAKRNGCEDRIRVFGPDQAPPGAFDVVLANILAKPLIDLAESLVGFMNPDAALVLSGIMENQAEWVAGAYREIRFSEPAADDGWVCLSGVKR